MKFDIFKSYLQLYNHIIHGVISNSKNNRQKSQLLLGKNYNRHFPKQILNSLKILKKKSKYFKIAFRLKKFFFYLTQNLKYLSIIITFFV